MNSETRELVTVNEAVARIINVDYIPEGFTLLEMTAAFLEEAEIDYENAADHEKSQMANRANICESRHQLARQMIDSIELELASNDCRIIQVKNTKSKELHFDMMSISDWAFYEFGIGTPTGINFGHKKITYSWEDITIKIYADYKLGLKIKNGEYRKSSFQAARLIGKKRNEPNLLGVILIGMSQSLPYPPGKTVQASNKTAISKLRHSLFDLANLSEDPFRPYNEGDGWRPRFTLIDDRRNADERAKDEAIFVQLDEERDAAMEAPDFEREKDDGQSWIDAEEHKRFTGNSRH
jgi:hypothetical protein